MPPVLGQRGPNFSTGHPSFCLLSMFPLKLYSPFLCNIKSSLPASFLLGPAQFSCRFFLGWLEDPARSASCSSGNKCALSSLTPINRCCRRRHHCPPSSEVSRYAVLYYLVCLTTSRPHIWSLARHRLIPSISSRLLSLPGERWRGRGGGSRLAAVDRARAEVRHGMNTSGHLCRLCFSSSLK